MTDKEKLQTKYQAVKDSLNYAVNFDTFNPQETFYSKRSFEMFRKEVDTALGYLSIAIEDMK